MTNERLKEITKGTTKQIYK